MAKPHNDLTAAFVKSILHYNPKAGIFRWKINVSRKSKKGSVAGYKNPRGYIYIGINYRYYFAHRLAYLYMTGKWPSHYIDHKNRNPSDNRWKILRPATPSQNNHNQAMNKRNKARLKGVNYDPTFRKWKAGICIAGKRKTIGWFHTPENAYAAYCKEAKKHFGEYARF